MILDWHSKKHVHVVTSTFVAELHALLEAARKGKLVNLVCTEWLGRPATAKQLSDLQEAGESLPELDAFIDAKAVYDSL